MVNKIDRLEAIRKMISRKKAAAFVDMLHSMACSSVTLRRDLKTLKTISSYTHRGSFVTLPSIPKFNRRGIWFFRGIGFSTFKNSFELMINIIENSKRGITKDEIEAFLQIGISKQIQILMDQERLHRIKIGAKYVYVPTVAANSKETRLKIVSDRQIEEHYEQEIKIGDLIAVLKVVLLEKKVTMRLLKQWIKKYSLKIPVAKFERIILKYKLDKKKTP